MELCFVSECELCFSLNSNSDGVSCMCNVHTLFYTRVLHMLVPYGGNWPSASIWYAYGALNQVWATEHNKQPNGSADPYNVMPLCY